MTALGEPKSFGESSLGPTLPYANRCVPVEAIDHVDGLLFRIGLRAGESALDTELADVDRHLLRERIRGERLADTLQQMESVANRVFLERVAVGIAESIQPTEPGAPFVRFEDPQVYFENPQHWLAHRAHTMHVVPPRNSSLGETLHVKRGFDVQAPFDRVQRSQKRPVPVWVVGEKKVPGSEGYEYVGLAPAGHTRTKWIGHGVEGATFYNGGGEDWSKASRILTKNYFTAVTFTLPKSAWLTPFDTIPDEAEVEAALDRQSMLLAYQQFYCSEERPHIAQNATAFSPMGSISNEQITQFRTIWYLQELAGHFGAPASVIETAATRLANVRTAIREEAGREFISSVRFEAMGRGKYASDDERAYRPWGEAIAAVLNRNDKEHRA